VLYIDFFIKSVIIHISVELPRGSPLKRMVSRKLRETFGILSGKGTPMNTTPNEASPALPGVREEEFRSFASQQLYERLVTIRQHPNIRFKTVSDHFSTAKNRTFSPLRVSAGSYSVLGSKREGFAIAVFRIGKNDAAYGIVDEDRPTCLPLDIDELISEVKRLRSISNAEKEMRQILEDLDDMINFRS
jgi:hypothetical protein